MHHHKLTTNKKPQSVQPDAGAECKGPIKALDPLTNSILLFLKRSTSEELSTASSAQLKRFQASRLRVVMLMSAVYGAAGVPTEASAGVELSNDFNAGIGMSIFIAASLLCLLNYLFLRRHAISRKQLESERRFVILRHRRGIAEFKFPSGVRTAGNLFFKVGSVCTAYVLVSSRSPTAVIIGLLVIGLLLAVNIMLVLKWTLHPKSVLHRRHLLYRKDPTFARVRLVFELIRRFVYFIVIFSFLTYGIHRLIPEIFSAESEKVPLFVQHVQANVAGMTSLGYCPLVPTRAVSGVLELIRSVFSATLLLVFINIMATGITAERRQPRPVLKFSDTISDLTADVSDYRVSTEDIRAVIDLTIETVLGVNSCDIKENSDIIRDLGADSLEVVEIQVQLEAAFESGEISEAEIAVRRTVGDLVALFADRLRDKNCGVVRVGENPIPLPYNSAKDCNAS